MGNYFNKRLTHQGGTSWLSPTPRLPRGVLPVLLSVLLFSCSVGPEDNRSIYRPDPDTYEPFMYPAIGTWDGAGDSWFTLTDEEVRCGDEPVPVLFLGQKYFQIEMEWCGLEQISPYQTHQPYTDLKIFRSDGTVVYQRR